MKPLSDKKAYTLLKFKQRKFKLIKSPIGLGVCKKCLGSVAALDKKDGLCIDCALIEDFGKELIE